MRDTHDSGSELARIAILISQIQYVTPLDCTQNNAIPKYSLILTIEY